MVAIDMPAGPSELLVIADSSANSAYIVSDLLSQAEHGVDSQVILVTVGFSQEKIQQVQYELEQQGNVLPRCEIAREAISKSLLIQTTSIE